MWFNMSLSFSITIAQQVAGISLDSALIWIIYTIASCKTVTCTAWWFFIFSITSNALRIMMLTQVFLQAHCCYCIICEYSPHEGIRMFSTTPIGYSVRYQRNLIGGVVFNCIDRFPYFVVMPELVMLLIRLLLFNMLILIMCRED